MWVESEGTAKSDFSFLAFHPCRYLQIADFRVRAANSPFCLRFFDAGLSAGFRFGATVARVGKHD